MATMKAHAAAGMSPFPSEAQALASPDVLLKLHQAATIMACSARTIARMIDRGELPAVKVLSERRVRMSDLQSLIRDSAAVSR